MAAVKSAAVSPPARAAALAGFSAYAIFYFVLDFQFRVLRSDDFAYIRSILGALERGRLYTYEYLAPYNATLTGLCALAYRLTGAYYLSTYGVLAAFALLAFACLWRLLTRRLPMGQAWILSAAFATFPLFQAKASDFHGSIPGLALFLLALLLFETGRTSWFFLAAFLAFANRQSHVVLLVLPLWRYLRALRSGGKPSPLVPVYSVIFVASALALHFSLNRTYTQIHAMSIVTGLAPRAKAAAQAALAGIFVSMAALALFGALFRPPLAVLRHNLRRWKPLAAAATVMLALALSWRPGLVCNDTDFFGFLHWNDLDRALPWILLAALPFVDYRLLRPGPYVALAAALILVISQKGMWWDYYFLEILALALLLVAERPQASLRRGAAGCALVFLFAINLVYGYFIRLASDRQYLAVSSLEKLERRGAVTVDAMTSAPYGYLGWKLFDYFIAHEGRDFAHLYDFMGYVSRNRVLVQTQLPWRRAYKFDPPPSAAVLESGMRRLGFVEVEYRIVDLRGPDATETPYGRPLRLDSARFHSPRFPLNEAEWKSLLDSLRLRPASLPAHTP